MRAFIAANRRELAIGLIAAGCMSVFWFAVRLFFGFGTPSELFLDRIAPFMPLWLFGALITVTFGYTNLKILGFLSIVVGQLVVGMAGAVIYTRVEHRKGARIAGLSLVVFGLLLFAAVAGALVPQLMTQYAGAASATAILLNCTNLFVGIALYALTAWLLLLPMRERNSAGHYRSRARFVLDGLGTAVAIAGAGALVALYRRTSFSYDGKTYAGAGVEAITPNDRFYQVTKNVIDPDVDARSWELEIVGLPGSAKTLRLGDLRGLDAVTQEVTLSCISNPVGGGLMSNAVWKGVPLAALLARGTLPKVGQARMLFRAADGYTDTIPLAKALDPTTLVAYEMNGEHLPSTHGFPVRMIVPGLFGEKSVKWLTGVELVPASAAGFYERQGWGPDFRTPIQSRIDEPSPSSRLSRNAQAEIKGVAFGGDRGISRVEVSTDGGRTWAPARIIYAATMLRWALWSLVWRPEAPGNYTLLVRAIGARAQPQIGEDRPSAPEGATGYHRVDVTVM